MELAFVLLTVLIGTGAIVYAGMRQPARKPDTATGEAAAAPVVDDGSDGNDG